MSLKNTLIIAALVLFQCLSSALAASSVFGRAVVDGFTGTGSLIIKFEETGEGNVMVIETVELNSANYSFSTADGDDETPPYEKISGLIDCVNIIDDDVAVVSGIVEGTAEEIWYHGGVEHFFTVGERFVTAVRGNSQGPGDQIGEISNLGLEDPEEPNSPGADYCMFFDAADDFNLQDVSTGHFAVKA